MVKREREEEEVRLKLKLEKRQSGERQTSKAHLPDWEVYRVRYRTRIVALISAALGYALYVLIIGKLSTYIYIYIHILWQKVCSKTYTGSSVHNNLFPPLSICIRDSLPPSVFALPPPLLLLLLLFYHHHY